MAERHSTMIRRTDPYDDPYDPWHDYGSHEAANTRAAMSRPDPSSLVKMLEVSPGLPCSLCTPDRQCSLCAHNAVPL